MSIKEIKEMIILMNEHDLVELELERDGLKVKLKKSAGEVQQIIAEAKNPPQAEAQGLIEIKSPMVAKSKRGR